MGLPISGPISATNINTELSLSATATLSLDHAGVRGLFERATGAVSFSHGHGKSSSQFLTYAPAAPTQYQGDYRTLAIAAGWNQNSYVELTINAGTIILSSSSGTPAFTINGPFPNGAKLINNGIIMGKGGTGGYGGGNWGAAGGTGIRVTAPITIVNNGTIGGGGGGGGGGGNGLGPTGGGGGGGGGYGTGGGGTSHGGAGSLYAGGGGGSAHGGSGKFSSSGPGGSGGASGAVGHGGGGGQRGQGAGGGGAAGAAVSGNGFVTWSGALGTTYGAKV